MTCWSRGKSWLGALGGASLLAITGSPRAWLSTPYRGSGLQSKPSCALSVPRQDHVKGVEASAREGGPESTLGRSLSTGLLQWVPRHLILSLRSDHGCEHQRQPMFKTCDDQHQVSQSHSDLPVLTKLSPPPICTPLQAPAKGPVIRTIRRLALLSVFGLHGLARAWLSYLSGPGRCVDKGQRPRRTSNTTCHTMQRMVRLVVGCHPIAGIPGIHAQPGYNATCHPKPHQGARTELPLEGQ
jgi:hypothetical protein